MLKNIFLVIMAEIKGIFFSKSIISILLFGPIVYFVLYPQPYLKEILRDIPIVIIDQDNSNQSRELVRYINGTDAVSVSQYVNAMADAEQLLKKRQAYGIVLIPNHFEKNLLEGRSAGISFYGDASYVLIYNNTATAVSSAVLANNSAISVQRQIAQGVDPAIAKGGSLPFMPNMVALFNPQSGYATYVIPPVFILILHQILLVGILVSSIIHRKSMHQLVNLFTPDTSALSAAFAFMIGKIIVYLLIYTIVFNIYSTLIEYLYHIPNLANSMTYFIFGLLFLVATISFALMLSMLIKRIDDVFLLIVPVSMIAFFLTGVSWPKVLIPDFLTSINYLIPAAPAMIGSIKMTQMGAPLSLIQPEMINLFILLLVYFFASLYLLWRKIKCVQYFNKKIE